MDYLDDVKKILYKNKNLGFKDYGNGAELIGHAPHVAPFAYLHRFYSSLNADDIILIERNLQQDLSLKFKRFLLRQNGISIFSGSLNIYGLRKVTDNTPGSNLQPFSIYTPNIQERVQDAENFFLFIGGYGNDGSQLYINTKNEKVYHCERYFSKQVRNEWSNFEIMLLEETERISKLFDSEGKKIKKH